jgi:hypothetical protein
MGELACRNSHRMVHIGKNGPPTMTISPS